MSIEPQDFDEDDVSGREMLIAVLSIPLVLFIWALLAVGAGIAELIRFITRGVRR